jgi:hypothetical protein
MASHAVASPAHTTAPGGAKLTLSIIGSSVLAGAGLFGTFYWLLTQKWLWFLSLAPLIVGAYLLFTRATGVDHA